MHKFLRYHKKELLNMLKLAYRDLAVILTLSIASLIFSLVPVLNEYPLNILPLLLILLFLPGYALMAVINPLFNQTPVIRRIIFSLIISIVLTMSLTLISIYTPFKTSNFLTLIILTLILSILAVFRRILFSRRLRAYGHKKEFESAKRDQPIESDEEDISQDEIIKKNVEDKKQEAKFTPTKKDENIRTFQRFSSLDLLLVTVLTILTVLFVLEPTLNKTVVRTVLGLLLVLFLPGYALIASLFPKKDDLDGIERLALSFGLSIAITPLIGLALNYTPFGIRLDPILISLTAVTLVLCAASYLRRRRIPEENRFQVDFIGFFKGLGSGFKGESKAGKILSVILICSIILAIVTTAYIIVTPKVGESFTEFYILGPGGKASDYPTNLTPGQEGKVIIGIVNHENKNTTYHLLVTYNDNVQMDQTFNLKDGEKMEIPFNFTAGDPGEGKLEFKLFKLPDDNNIYRSLHLWLNTTEGSSAPSG